MLAELCIVTLLSQVLNGVDNFLYMVFLQRAEGPFNRRILQKAGRLDPLLYENAETLDDINKAQNGSTRAIQLGRTIVSTLTFYLPYFIFMGIYLFTLKPILAISLLVVPAHPYQPSDPQHRIHQVRGLRRSHAAADDLL